MNYKKIEPQKLFFRAQEYIVNILIVYIILVLVVGLAKTLFDVRLLVAEAAGGPAFARTVTDILTFLVIIELFRGFVEFFKSKRFRLHSMMDPALVLL